MTGMEILTLEISKAGRCEEAHVLPMLQIQIIDRPKPTRHDARMS